MMIFLKYHKAIIGVFIIGSIVSAYFTTQLKVDYDLKDYRPDNDPGYELIRSHYEDFNISENYLIIGLSNREGIFKHDFLEKVKMLTLSIDTIGHVKSSRSIMNTNRMVYSALGLMNFPFVHLEDISKYKSDSARIMDYPLLRNWLISGDGDALAVQVSIEPDLSKETKADVIDKIVSLVQDYGFDEVHFGGNTYTDVMYARLLSREMILMVTLTMLILIALSLIMYRSVRVLGILFLVVIGGLAYLYGYLSLVRGTISMINMVFPTLILIVGMSDFIHLYSGFTSQIVHYPRDVSIRNTLKTIGLATFMTSLTTAVGFMTLSTISIKPIRLFGIDAAFGVMVTFLIAIAIIPSVLLVMSPTVSRKVHSHEVFFVPWIIKNASTVTTKFPRRILLVFFALLIISTIGIFYVDTNSYLLSHLKDNAVIKQDFRYFEEKFAGIRDLEINVTARDGHSIHEIEVLREINKLEEYLNGFRDFGMVISPASLYKFYNWIYHYNSTAQYTLPADDETLESLRKTIGRYNWRMESNFIDPGMRKARVYVLMTDIGRKEKRDRIEEIKYWSQQNIDQQVISMQFTGYAVLFDNANELIVKSIFISLLIALLIISLIMAFLFRSLKMVIISLLPNIFPLLSIGSLMSLFGIELHGSLAIVFTIGFVIVVDDTIHFLARYRLLLKNDISKDIAISQTMRETGRAIIMTSVLIFLGFLILIFSHFKEITYFGILLSITSVIALLSDIIVLPALLKAFN